MNIPPELTFEVLVRLPLKSLARFRSVRKEWKLVIDSEFFRDCFMSHNSSSVSWSIIQTRPHKLTLEIVGHHGCKTWGLTRSPGSLVGFFADTTIKRLRVLACTDGLVLIYTETSYGTPMHYVGNPLFQEWCPIPLPSYFYLQSVERIRNHQRFNDSALVIKMQSGAVVSYKVVWLFPRNSTTIDFLIYSSDTGMWEARIATCLHSSFWFSHHKPIALNGILHWLCNFSTSFVAYDFYGGHDDYACHIISFPDCEKDDDQLRRFRRTLSTSDGSIVYFNEFGENGNRRLRVWRLVKYTGGPEAWQLFWEVSLASVTKLGIDYFPVVMHPLKSEIIYLWSRNKKGMVLFNLRTNVFSLHKESEDETKCMDGCTLSFNRCSEYMETIHNYGGPNYLLASQYVLPRWLHRLPRPQPS
ncbi:unnamed protein product [Arabidopsis thaliana]|uniref:Putative F-box protein At3g23970 n=2 Tax=Arabidopsis thaliana TaxID=3702 RepID=FB183_ARATH|nr:F-box family protein [Arabidopsis thaliana]Q9LIR0.1 RecName: Full=Putative F-box protein At3g23970 [Arabidopsis thaliana]AEE76840.1 F-box family protein [Arabidopsis thaliana]CAA0383494.1 unnamed protein product [Arabidopsis thaliana]CAD5323975.1 unnamed protein product [Arabidopsis thaliana]BAB03015.1 unnamed protein product [Arabidopsis thaliana]|eukprot:NP_189039.1 F-box family protein [Arabidopsis thaliana]